MTTYPLCQYPSCGPCPLNSPRCGRPIEWLREELDRDLIDTLVDELDIDRWTA